MSGLLALRLARGGLLDAVQELRALAFDNQSANFTNGLRVTGRGVLGVGTLTLAGNAVAAETVTIGTVVYTWRAAVGVTANEVLIGANASDSLDNLIDAINRENGGGEAGTVYGSATVVHPTVSAAAGAGDTMVVTERLALGAVIATTETMTQGSWGAATLAGGIAASNATGILIEHTDAGATGILQLRDVVGEFTDNERLTDSSTGAALANGTMTAPLLTPSDAAILQADADTILRGEAVEMIGHLEAKIETMPWHADNGLFALRVGRGEQRKDVERLGALAYDGQTVNFTVGRTITGGTSGAHGVLIEQTDGGATGTIILNEIVGTFANNDVLTEAPANGTGDANGVQSIPLLTPAADEMILQLDGVDMTKAEALEVLRQIKLYVMRMKWPAAAAA